ncbi:CBS domain-containing protein [Ruminococcus sp.]|uniref:CBS domain-containing protein n=1 Tax=Ruminococcus sp. TaxID=41978 RepID=UPI0025FBA296|nr:CBS domain-containing protein [Ruminococcus sp.]
MNILKFLKPKACVDYVYDDNTARQALEKMKNHSFTAVPVIDREGKYVKTLAEGDFLWFMLNNGIQNMRELEEYKISEITRRVRMKPVYVYSTIEDLILLSMDQNFVPVIDDREMFIGIVTRRDILKYCHSTLKDYDQEYGTEETREEVSVN